MFELLDFGTPFWYTFGIFWVPFRALLGSFGPIGPIWDRPGTGPMGRFWAHWHMKSVQGTIVRYQNVKHVSTLFNLLYDYYMSRKPQINSALHKYPIASEWQMLQNPTVSYGEKLNTIRRVKEKLGNMSKQGPHTKFIVEACCQECRTCRNADRIKRYRLRRRRTNA